MKRHLIIFAMMLTAVTANAQKSSFGIKGGINFANIVKSDDENFNTDYNTGFNAGIFMDLHVIGALSFAPEILYSQKGYKTEGSSLIGGPFEYRLTSNFVEVPLLAKLKAGSGLGLYVGPQFSFLTSTKTKFTNGSTAYQNQVDEEVDNLRKNILGGVIGIGIDAGKKAVITGRYAIDFKKNNGDGSSQIPEYKNQVYMLSLGIKL